MIVCVADDTEISKLQETLNKAYDFMKQFVMDRRSLFERFLESTGQVVEKVGMFLGGKKVGASSSSVACSN